MLTDNAINPHRFKPEIFSNPAILDLANRVTLTVDDNIDPNALSPQRLHICIVGGGVFEVELPNMLGSPAEPLSPQQIDAKRDLCKALTAHINRRLFDNPLAYFTEPQ